MAVWTIKTQMDENIDSVNKQVFTWERNMENYIIILSCSRLQIPYPVRWRRWSYWRQSWRWPGPCWGRGTSPYSCWSGRSAGRRGKIYVQKWNNLWKNSNQDSKSTKKTKFPFKIDKSFVIGCALLYRWQRALMCVDNNCIESYEIPDADNKHFQHFSMLHKTFEYASIETN